MPRTATWAVTCTNCGRLYEAIVWSSVNTKSPNLVEAVTRGRLNVATCRNCGTSTFVPAPVLYNDMKRNLWVQIDPFLEPQSSTSKFNVGIEGVRYRPHFHREIQLIKVDSHESARNAIQHLADTETFDNIRKSHPNWPDSIVWAEVFLHHYEKALSAVAENETIAGDSHGGQAEPDLDDSR